MTVRYILLTAAVLLAAQGCSSDTEPVTSTLIVGATVFDGTGADGIDAAVRLDGDRIVDVGDITPLRGEAVIDATGLVLAPGFIDSHSHHDAGLEEHRLVPAVLSQGITTIVRGNDGFYDVDNEQAFKPLAEFNRKFIASPAAVNVASYSPHNSIRHRVLGSDYRRESTLAERTEMARLVEADMRAGAIGVSTGLEYEPGMFASAEEVVHLASVAAEFGGTYSSHIRDEDDRIMEALGEVIHVGREAGILALVSHIKLADRALWGTTDSVLEKLDAARADGVDIRADIYPYERWASNLAILFPSRDYTDRSAAEFTFEHTADAGDIVLVHYPPDPEFEGLSVADVARLTERDPETTLMQLARAAEDYRSATGQTGARIVAKGMNETDVGALMNWRFTNICSDGGLTIGHPRSYGAFPRVFRRFVNELGLLTLAEAIHKMTGLTADSLHLVDRGLLKPGMYADLVLFDPDAIADHATMESTAALSTGIVKVWVNGALAFDDGAPTSRYAGRIVTLTD